VTDGVHVDSDLPVQDSGDWGGYIYFKFFCEIQLIQVLVLVVPIVFVRSSTIMI
jgi:hypothetical protein